MKPQIKALLLFGSIFAINWIAHTYMPSIGPPISLITFLGFAGAIFIGLLHAIYARIVSPKITQLPNIDNLVADKWYSFDVEITAKFGQQLMAMRYLNYENKKAVNEVISSKILIVINTDDNEEYSLERQGFNRTGLYFGLSREENKKLKNKLITKISVKSEIPFKDVLLRWESVVPPL